MHKIGLVYKLMGELSEAIWQNWDNGTRASITIDNDGYMSLSVERCQEDDGKTPVEAWKRRELYDSWRMKDGRWAKDRSRDQNDYYKEHRLLLEEV